MRQVRITGYQVAQTLHHLQEAGRQQKECVVLWLGRNDADGVVVQDVYRPGQVAHSDIFRIPPASMGALLEILSDRELMIAAQVHSHPFHAFHSEADDDWAIVRHLDALSLVLPDFALRTDSASFLDHVKVFHLTATNRWVGVANDQIGRWLEIQ